MTRWSGANPKDNTTRNDIIVGTFGGLKRLKWDNCSIYRHRLGGRGSKCIGRSFFGGDGIFNRNRAGGGMGRACEGRIWICPGAFGAAEIRGLAPQSGTSAELLAEYRRFRGQGFTPAQAKYLTEPYPLERDGHHFPIPQKLAEKWNLPDWLRDSPFNVLRPNGISRGRFYELHYRVDPSYHGSGFPRSIGGAWSGRAIGLQRYEGLTRLWYGTPGSLKVAGGVIIVVGTASGGYYFLFVPDRSGEEK